jgi:hypothetical protein
MPRERESPFVSSRNCDLQQKLVEVWMIGSISDPIISWISEWLIALLLPPEAADMQQSGGSE